MESLRRAIGVVHAAESEATTGVDNSVGSSSELADNDARTLGLPLALLGGAEVAGETKEECELLQMDGARRGFAGAHEAQPKAGGALIGKQRGLQRKVTRNRDEEVFDMKAHNGKENDEGQRARVNIKGKLKSVVSVVGVEGQIRVGFYLSGEVPQDFEVRRLVSGGVRETRVEKWDWFVDCKLDRGAM